MKKIKVIALTERGQQITTRTIKRDLQEVILMMKGLPRVVAVYVTQQI